MAQKFLTGVEIQGTLDLESVSTNTSATAALVLNEGEVQQRTLGSLAFSSATIPTDFVSKANGGTFNGNIGVQDIAMGSDDRFQHGSYLEVSYGASNTSQFTFNADYDGGQTETYTPHYSGTSNSGMSIIKMPSGGVGGLDFYVKNHGTTSGSHNLSTFTKILKLNQNGNSTFAGDVTVGDDLNISGNELTFTNDAATAYIRGADALIIESDHDNDDSGSKPIYFYTNGVEMAKMEATATTFAGDVTSAKLNVNQAADGQGLVINGYDDHSSSGVTLQINSAGHARLSQTTDGSSGYLFLQAENYLQLIAGSFIYTTSTFRIYDNTQLQFGNSADYKLYHSTSADTLCIHTNDDKGITIDNAGNTTFTDDVTIQGDLSISGSYTQIDTDVNTTEQWIVTNDGTGPAAIINQKGVQDIFDVQDDGTSVFYIEDGGNVGIGTTDPDEKLEVSGGHIKITNAGNTSLYINANNSGSDATIFFEELDSVKAKIQHDASNDSMLFTDGAYTDTMTLKGGNVGIGTTDPSEKLEVMGGLVVNSGFNTGVSSLYLSHTGTQAQHKAGIFTTYTTGYGRSSSIQFALNSEMNGNIVTTSDAKMTILEGGNVGIGTTSPDTKLHVINDTQFASGQASVEVLKLQRKNTGGDIKATTEGHISMWATDSNNNTEWGRISWVNDNAADGGLETEGAMSFWTSREGTLTRAMYIDHNQQVGIGTTSPSYNLDVSGDIRSTGATRINTNAHIGGFIDVTGIINHRSNLRVLNKAATNWITWATRDTSGSESVINLSNIKDITALGNVGIGTTLPSTKLHVRNGEATIASDTDGVKLSYSNGNSSGIIDTAFSDNNLEFRTNGTAKMWIANAGNVGIGTTSPGEKLEVDGNIKADSFKVDGETDATKFLKGDGTLDSSTYLTSTNLDGYLLNTTDTLTGDLTVTGDVTIDGGNLDLNGVAPIMKVNSSNNSSGFRLNVTGLDGDGDTLFRAQDSGTTRFTIKRNGDATFAGTLVSANSGGYFRIQNAAGNSTYPTYSFQDDANTGMLSASSDSLGFITGGATALTLDSAQDATFAGNLTVGGDLIVNGTTTTLNTTTVEVEDNILQLNTTQGTPDTATAATSGISIYRGDGIAQASLIFDDGDDTWDLTNKLNVAGNIQTPKFIAAQLGYDDGYRLTRSGHDTYRICLGNSEGLRIFNETDSREELTFAGNGNATFAGEITSGAITITGGSSQTVIDADVAFDLTDGSKDTLLITNDKTTSAVGSIGPSIGFGNMNSDRRTSAIGAIRTGSDHDNMGLAFFTHPGDGNDDTVVKQFELAHDGAATFAGEVLIASGEYLSWGTSGSAAIEGSTVSDRLRFYTDSTLALTLDSSQDATFAGDILPDADSTYDIGSNTSKWAEGHFDHLYVGETGNNPRIDIYTENGTTSIADTFSDSSTDKSYIYFNAGTNSNDPGFIMHETSESANPDERNEGVLHLVPSDDNTGTDYVSIHGTNDPDAVRIYTSGLIETGGDYQLQIKSGSSSVYINDHLSVENGGTFGGDLGINGGNLTINGAYPRFNMYSTDTGEDDYSIINNNGIFGIYNVTNASYFLSLAETTGNATFSGTITADNFSGSSSGTNTGDQDLSGYSTTSHNHDGRYLRTHSRYSDDLDTITTSGVYIWDVSEADDEPTGAADGLLTIKYWDSSSWATASFQDFHNRTLHIKSKKNGTWQTDWAQVWTTDQLTTTNKSNYDTAYTHSQAAHAPTDAEKNVQADWDATSGDALILNKPTIPTDHGDHDGLYLPIGGGTITGNLQVNGQVTQAGVVDRVSWGKTYAASNTNIATLTTNDGSALPTGGAYRMTGHISGTGTEQVSMAVFWNENGTWYCNNTFAGGTSSNHIEFLISGSVPKVKTWHTNNYNINVSHERLSLDEGSDDDNLRGYFGADSYLKWLESTNTLTVPGDATFTGNITMGSGKTVDGVDISALPTTFAPTDAEANQTAAELLAAIKTVDGSGSGLDADTLDTYSSSAFARKGEANPIFTGGLSKKNSRSQDGVTSEYPLGHYTPGETLFEIDPTWSDAELKSYFDSNSVSWDEVANAPGGYAIYINGSVGVGGAYASGFPLIPIDEDGVYYQECWIKNATSATMGHYMGSNDYEADFTYPDSGAGNPGSYGYWVMSNTNPGDTWTKVSGYITGHHASNQGAFENNATYFTPLALFNYTTPASGTRACWISGWKVIRVDKVGDRIFQDDVQVKGKLEIHTLDTSTGSNTALVMNNNEVEKRDLGSLAFSNDTLPTSYAPTDAEANVQSDWNATSGDALILNKPTIPPDYGAHNGVYLKTNYRANWIRLGYGNSGGVRYHKLATLVVASSYVDYNATFEWTGRYASGTAGIHLHSDGNTTAVVYGAWYEDFNPTKTLEGTNGWIKYTISGDTVEIWIKTDGWREFDYILKDSVTEGSPTLTWYDENTTTDQSTEPSNLNAFTNRTHTAAGYSTASGVADNAEVNVQADWNETTTTDDAYIKNKPSIPTDFVSAANGGTFSGNVTIANTADVVFEDTAGTFPTSGKGFDWTLNNDGARIYAIQPSSDSIDFVFQLRDNATTNDRFVFHVKEWQGASYDKYPLIIRGGTQFDLSDSALYSNNVLRMSNSGVLSNVSGNISMFTNNSGYITSFDITTQTDSKYLRSNANDTATGIISITNSTASTSKTTGALKVTGGVGISGALNVGGDVVAYASSDERLKDNIELISDPIEKVQSLKGVTWNWNENADELQQSLPSVGVIAQDVEKVLPELVTDRDDGYKGVDYAKLTGLLIEAIKEQQKQIEELKKQIK